MSALTFDEFVEAATMKRRETPYLLDHVYPGDITITERASDIDKFTYIDSDGIKNTCAADKLRTLQRRAYLRYLLATDNELLPLYSDKEIADMVRSVSHIYTVEDRSPNVVASVCANLLVSVAHTVGSHTTTIKLDTVNYCGEEIGDWEVRIARLD